MKLLFVILCACSALSGVSVDEESIAAAQISINRGQTAQMKDRFSYKRPELRNDIPRAPILQSKAAMAVERGRAAAHAHATRLRQELRKSEGFSFDLGNETAGVIAQQRQFIQPQRKAPSQQGGRKSVTLDGVDLTDAAKKKLHLFMNSKKVPVQQGNQSLTLAQRLEMAKRAASKRGNATSTPPPPPPPPYVPAVGFCGRNNNSVQSLWLEQPNQACFKTACMYSPTLQHGVKLLRLPTAAHVEASQWDEANPNASCMARSTDKVSTANETVVSLIFTVHNSPEMAVRCILDIFSTILEIPDATEMVVVDDASDADMSAVHGLLRTLRVLFGYRVNLIVSERNLGYGASNNIALKAAKGEYALLLNSDILVNPGWLAALLHTMRTYPRAGMVGPMMVGLDGLVKEAGGFVYQGGKPSNFGRRMKPDKVPYLHARAVDYISAACLLVRRQLFLDLGLFDPQFEPAYYEDTDAAMVHLRAGWLTVLQPLAVVTHAEGASISSKAKEDLMARNKQRFYEKHRAVLDNFCPAVGHGCRKISKNIAEAFSSFARDGPHVLLLEKHLPRPDRDSGSVRLFEIVRIFMQLGYKVSIELLAMLPAEDTYRVSLLAEGVHVHKVGTLKSMVAQMDVFNKSGAVMRCPWDVIFISKRSPFSIYIDDVKTVCPQAPIIYDTVDVHFIREERQAVYIGTNETETANNKEEELRFMRMSDVNYVVSDYEQTVLHQTDPSLAVSVLSNIYPPPTRMDAVPLASRRGALFVGNLCHHPNRDALDFIFKHMAPIIKKNHFDDIKIHLVVSNLYKCKYRRLSKYARRYKMPVYLDVSNEELLRLHRRVRMVIAPLRFGAGVKGKVNYALLHGLPVVATSIATEGMHMVDGESVMSAESAKDFVVAMRKVANDDTLWRHLQRGGWDVMDGHFTREVAQNVLTETLTTRLNLTLPAWGSGVDSPSANLRACPNNGSAVGLPSSCGGCWHCPLNKHFYFPPV